MDVRHGTAAATPALADVMSRDVLEEHSTMNTRFVIVAKTADIKPELAAFDVEGVRIAVANANGRFFAIDDTCTHEQCSLAEKGRSAGRS